MLKRNKLPREQQQTPIIQQQTQYNDHPRAQILSPNPPSNRLERKQREDLSSAKSTSLNAKLVRKNFQNGQQRLRNLQGAEKNQQNPYLLNIDYYPYSKQQAKSPRIQRTPLHFPQKREGKEIVPSVESAPNLMGGEDWRQLQPRQKRQQQQMSTQLSKQSDDFKEVRFKSQLQQPQRACLKKKKVRSPSILKNGSRNILNGSMISEKSRERSSSAASGRERSSYMRTSNENNTNKIIKQKYKSILNKLQAQSKTGACGRGNRFSGAVYSVEQKKIQNEYKYRDEIFPPVYSSLFATKIGRPKVGEELSWMRISDIFSDREICIIGATNQIEISRTTESYASDSFISVLNSLQGSPRLLTHIFQNQQINPFGIYLINIYQQNTWKYIIIDDYIPVNKAEGKITPAFVNLNSSGSIPIWPLLLQKAYANYYARYEALQHGNLIDLAEELSGTPSRRILLKNQGVRKGEKMNEGEMQHSLKRLKNQARNGQVIMIGELLGDKGHIPIVYSSKDKSLFYNDPNSSFKRRVVTFDSLPDLCRAVNIISPLKYDSCSLAVIRKNRSSITKPRNDSLFDLQIPSIRKFTVSQPSQFMISLRQREKRLFHLKPEIGEYIWCRFILLQKEYGQNGFRWIDGEYNCCKSINFCCFLEAGQYWLLVEPEWRSSSASQIWIQIHGRPTQPQRHIFSHQQRAIQHACLDLAQRHGQLNQINKFICSYNYITQKVGLIIESIINERINGQVTVMRSIKGLKCKVQILPVNREFYEEVVMENGLKGYKLNEEIELDIPKKQQFTVVLKLKGGVDRKFFKSFDFGC